MSEAPAEAGFSIPWVLLAVSLGVLSLSLRFPDPAPASQSEAQSLFLLASGGVAAKASPASILSASWLHGDLSHALGNLLGLWIFGLPRDRPGARSLLILLLAAGCFAGHLVNWVGGHTAVGLSGGVHAVVGWQLACPSFSRYRIVALAWLGLSALGGAGVASIDNLSHALGAALGVAIGWIHACQSKPLKVPALAGIAGGGLVLGLGLAHARLGPAKIWLETRSREIQILSDFGDYLLEEVPFQTARLAAFDRVQADQARGVSLEASYQALHKALRVDPERRTQLESQIEGLIPFFEAKHQEPLLEGFAQGLPEPPPAAFRSLEVVPFDDAHEAQWVELLEWMRTRSRKLEAASEALKTVREILAAEVRG